MTLFGALSSGVSGLTAQSSAIGAISDNITNISTVGYKNTQVDFQTLVTKQTSATFFSAGGVQSRPRQDTGVQGLLASSSSSTDIAISGNGFFVVNEASQPTINNEFLFTRAGSFFQDNEGFLRNTSGFYLQAWPTDAAGVVVPANKSLNVPNQNVISTDFLTTVNLNRVGGTASATSTIAIGANLPSNDTAGTERKTDVQFFDSLGNATSLSINAIKTTVDNNWDLVIEPPPGTAVLTLEDGATTPLTYDSIGQIEFLNRAAEGSVIKIDGISYVFTRRRSRKWQNLLHNPEVSLCSDRNDVPYAYVLVQGVAAESDRSLHDAVRKMADIYYEPERAAGMAGRYRDGDPDIALVAITPERVLSWEQPDSE